jgi:hypothetical protein
MTGPVAGKGQGVPAQEEHLPLPHFSMHFRADDTFISERRHFADGESALGRADAGERAEMARFTGLAKTF